MTAPAGMRRSDVVLKVVRKRQLRRSDVVLKVLLAREVLDAACRHEETAVHQMI